MVIVAKALDVTALKYSHTKDRLLFEVRRRASLTRYLVKLHGKPKISFVIEAFHSTKADQDRCMHNSTLTSEIMQKFLVDCRGPIEIRFKLTKEEGKQIRNCKNERKGKVDHLIWMLDKLYQINNVY